jgi:hypothetical protein
VEYILYLLLCMKQTNVFNSNQMHFKHSPVGTCLTIFRSVVLVLLSASFLTACNQGSTTNNYGPDNAGMSGGGSTKDPGDGTGGSTGDGGGGQGIQCGDSNNPKIKNRLFVRDVYEALNDQKLQMKTIPNESASSDAVSAEAIEVLVSSIRSYFGPASPNLEFTNEDFWKNFSKKISFIDDDRELHASQDANSPIALPKECRVVQIAYWSDTSEETDGGTLYVSAKYWRNLDQLNKIALMAHEFFFKQARRAHYENSDTVRFKIGQILSANGARPLFDQWLPSKEERAKEILPASMNGFKICKGSANEEPTAKINFYQYEGKDGRQHFTIPLLTSNSINLSFLNDSQFSFDPKENPDLAASTDLLIYPPKLYKYYYEVKRSTTGTFLAWFMRWYSNVGIIKTEETSSNLLVDFLFKYQNATKKGDTFWGGKAGPKNNPVKIELLNHTQDLKDVNQKPLKTREELINSIHNQMELIVDACFEVKEKQVNGAMLTIDKEIREIISSGTFTDSFPQWVTLLQSLKPRPEEINLRGQDPCKEQILHHLPNALLDVSANNYDEISLGPILGDSRYMIDNSSPKIAPGLMRVSQSNTTLDFNLICDDFRQTYFDNFGLKNALKTDLSTKEKNIVTMPWRDSKLKLNVAGIKIAAQIDFYYEQIASFLSFTQNGPQNFQRLITSYKLACPKNVGIIFGKDSCAHHESFLSELSSEKNIQLKLCPQALSIDGNKNFTICVVSKMETTQNSYLIYFGISEDTTLETPYEATIDLVRMVPSE